MNENYYGYGGEDNDLWFRANRRLGESAKHNVTAMPYVLAHSYHDWSQPSEERFAILNRTLQNPGDVESRLARRSLGSNTGQR